jgi:hypothetical protein
MCAFVGLQYKFKIFNIFFRSYAYIFLLRLFIYHETQLRILLIPSVIQNIVIFEDMLLHVCLIY